MKTRINTSMKRIFSVILSIALLCGFFIMPARAEEDPLIPGEKEIEGDGIVLNKWAERIAADEWKVHVSATIEDTPVETPKLEVTFVLDVSGSMNTCAHEAEHALGLHYFHSDSCPLLCTDTTHAHVDSCYVCGKTTHIHNATSACSRYSNEEGKYVTYTSRFQIAKQVIATMESRLPEETRVRRVVFGGSSYCKQWDGVSTVTPQGETFLMNGVRLALDPNPETGDACFTNDSSTKKILIIVTDGAATDGEDYGKSDPSFQQFINTDNCIVYTVGFNHNDPNLESMATKEKGGTYSTASDPDELELIFNHLSMELTAMIVDPMGPSVGFDTTSVTKPAESVNGNVAFESDSNTLYWNPENNNDIANSTIAYSYTVKLNKNSGTMAVGVHSGVPLNNTTSLKYSMGNEQKTADFNIPKATYAVSSMQVNWKSEGADLKSPTATETIICDFGDVDFETDYKTITPVITKNGVDYYYTGTTITKNGEAVNGVTVKDAAAFVVTHNYSQKVTYQVSYEYTGTVPENAPDASLNNVFGLDAGASVDVAAAPTLDGWVFSGWTVSSGNATVENGSLTMPEGNVTLTGSWAKLNGYRVLLNYFTSTNGGEYVQDNPGVIEFVEETITADANVQVDISDALTWSGSQYGNPALADGSAAATISGNLVSITPSSPTADVVINLYRNVRTAASVTVKFVDEEGNELRADMTSNELYVGDSFDVSDAEDISHITVNGIVYDFASDDDASYTGTVPEGGIVITRVYTERAKAAVVVHFVDGNGNSLREDITSGDIYLGSAFNVSSADDIESITAGGKIYDFVHDSGASYTGTIPAGGLEITRVYAERAKASVTVKFVDDKGNALRDSITTDDIYIGLDFDVSEAKDVSSITADGIIYDFESDGGASYTGSVPTGGIVITRVYAEREKAAVIVHFVDSEGNELREDITSGEIYIDGTFDVSSAEEIETITVDGVIYDFESDGDASYTGSVPTGGKEITRVYRERDKASVIVHFVDEEGNALREDAISSLYVDTEYDVSDAKSITSITVNGKIYDFESDDSASYTGIVPAAGVEITRVYTERDKAVVTVRFVDENGKALREDFTSDDIYLGLDFDVSEAEEIETITAGGIIYDFKNDGDASYTGTVAKGIVITRVYAERSKASVIVKFVDEDGNELCSDTISSLYVGTAYDVSVAQDITSINAGSAIYDFVSDGDAAYTGTVPEGGIEIIRVYKERAKATVIVKFVDNNGNALRADVTSGELYVGNSFDVSDAEDVSHITANGKVYDFVSDGSATYAGTVPAGGIVITRVYAERAKASAVVHFVDENGNALRDDISSGEIYLGSAFDVSSAENIETITVGGKLYDFVGDSDAAYIGLMPEGGVVISRVYSERGKAAVIVHFVDENDNALRDYLTSGDIYIGLAFDVSDAEEIETITVDGVIYDFLSDGNAAYTGSVPEGGIEIKRVYTERSKAPVVVHFVDEEGNSLTADIASSIYVDTAYDVSDAKDVETITVSGKIYDFKNDGDASYAGSVPASGIEITRVYAERSKASATVEFVDEDGNKLRDDLASDSIYIGLEFDVSDAEEIETITVGGKIYDFTSDNSAYYTGLMPEGGVEITRVYTERSKAPVVVHFVDEDGNTLAADIASSIYVDTAYDVSDAKDVETITVSGKIYDFKNDGDPSYAGSVPANGIEITRVYAERAKASVIVKFVDNNGNTLRADINSGEIYVGNNFDVSDAEDVSHITANGKVYDFVSDGDANYTGSVPAGGLEIKRVYKERDKASVIVHFVDDNGSALREDISSGSIYIDSAFDVSSAENIETITVDGVIYDFVSDGNAAYTGIIPAGGKEITRVYSERSKAPVVVHFVDENDNTLADDVASSIYIDTAYDVSDAKDVETITAGGKIYDFVSDNDAAYTGTVPAGGVEITRVYSERDKASAVVKFVDEDGNKLRGDLTSGNIYIGLAFDVSNAEEIETITVGGKIYDFVSDGDASYTGTIPVGGIVITRVYTERSKAPVVVHFVDEDGNTLAADIASSIYVDTAYDVSDTKDVETITVDGKIYDFKNDGDASYTGTVPANGIEITRVYAERAKASATVKFIDSNGNKLRDNITSDSIYVGNSFDVSSAEEIESITVDGILYDFVSDDNAAYTGTMPEDGLIITRVYAERDKSSVTVHFVDENGNALREDVSSGDIYIDLEFDVSEAEEIESITVDDVIYDFVSDDDAAYTGTVPANGIEITRVYKERSKAFAIVHFVDENGSALREDISSGDIYIDLEYDVSEAEEIESITVDDVIYDFAGDDDAAYTGAMPEDGVEITRVYKERAKAAVTVLFVDGNGNKLREDMVSDSIYIGLEYDVSAAEEIVSITADDIIYDFESDGSAAYKGTMPEGGLVITRVYNEHGKASVIVHFVDNEGNTLREDITSGSIYIGNKYDVSDAKDIDSIDINGVIYDFVSDDNADYKGKVPETGIEITRVYKERAKATVTVHFVDKDGNKLADDTTLTLYVGESYDVSLAKDVTYLTVNGVTYSFVSDDSNDYKGKLPESGVEITRVYEHKTSGGSSTEPTTPPTGDKGIGLWAALLLISASAISVLVYKKRKAGRN